MVITPAASVVTGGGGCDGRLWGRGGGSIPKTPLSFLGGDRVALQYPSPRAGAKVDGSQPTFPVYPPLKALRWSEKSRACPYALPLSQLSLSKAKQVAEGIMDRSSEGPLLTSAAAEAPAGAALPTTALA
eukprot:g14240.t1